MALFKVFRGESKNLDSVPKNDGYAYFCTDDGSFWIDHTEGTEIIRTQISRQAWTKDIEAAIAALKDESTYTNLADPASSDWKDGYRLGSSGPTAATGRTVSNLIEWSVGDVIRVKGVTFYTSVDPDRVYHCTNNTTAGTYAYIKDLPNEYFDYEIVNGVHKFTLLKAGNSTLKYFRISFITPEDSSNVIITKNEEIIENNSSKIAHLEVQVENIENRVEKLESAVNVQNIPEYWKEYLTEKIAEIKALQAEGGKDCFSFIVLADTHYPSNLGKNSPILAKEILDKCDIRYALLLGDAQTRGCHNTKELLLAENEQIEEMLSPIRDRLLQTEGNHDGSYGWLDRDGDGKYDNTDKEPAERESYVYNLTPAELHSAIYRKVGLVGDVHFDESGSGYYSDDVANKVRYIVLNTQCNKYELQEDGTSKYPKMWLMNFTQPQFDLVIDALNNIPSNSWKVVVAGHCPLFQEIGDREIMQGVLNAYKNKTSYSGEYEGVAKEEGSYVNLADEFSSDWLKNTRYNSSYQERYFCNIDTTNYIEITSSSILHLKNFDIINDFPSPGENYGRIYFYDENKNFLHYIQPSTYVDKGWLYAADYNEAVTIVKIYEIAQYFTASRDLVKYVRFSGVPRRKYVIITDNEAIPLTTGYINYAEPLPNNTTDTTKWVNGYRVSSTGLTARADTSVSNSFDCKYGDIIRIKGVPALRENDDRFVFTTLQLSDGVEADNYVYWNQGPTYGINTEIIDGVYVIEITNFSVIRLRFAMPTPTAAEAQNIIITVNQEIVGGEFSEISNGRGYDYVSVNCDFSNAKGQLVGYFHGHTHVDSDNTTNGIKNIGTRCDAQEENTEEMRNERVAGTITEQSFDVFTVNTKTNTIYATKIGAGEDREIGYDKSVLIEEDSNNNCVTEEYMEQYLKNNFATLMAEYLVSNAETTPIATKEYVNETILGGEW